MLFFSVVKSCHYWHLLEPQWIQTCTRLFIRSRHIHIRQVFTRESRFKCEEKIQIFFSFFLFLFSVSLWWLENLGWCHKSQNWRSRSPTLSTCTLQWRREWRGWNVAYFTWNPSTGKSIKDHRHDFDSAVDRMSVGSRWILPCVESFT